MQCGGTRGFAVCRPWLLGLICWGCGVVRGGFRTILGGVAGGLVLCRGVLLEIAVGRRLEENYGCGLAENSRNLDATYKNCQQMSLAMPVNEHSHMM